MRFVLANGIMVIAFIGVLYFQYFVQPPFVNQAVVSASQLRNPAATKPALSVPVDSKPISEKKLVEQDWKYALNCKDVQKEMTQQKDSVILNLKKCEKEFPKEIVVENQTNGFTASLFAISNAHSKTDSIPLKKGKNLIVIKYLLSTTKVKAKGKNEPLAEVVEKLSIQH
jgi:hypothetical protein